MYETFYRLRANPFRLVPDPEFCFYHSGNSEARAYLSFALTLEEGFVVITGRPGTGKTTLIQAFLRDLDASQVVARSLAASNLKAAELLRAVAYAFELDVAGMDKATLRRRIQAFFVEQVEAGRRVLLIVDEAQGLPHHALEELRLLADLQTGSRPLLQLFLVGQEKLRDLLRAPSMEQFQQRVIGAFHLEPLGIQDTKAYVEHRLRHANWRGDPEITGAAMLGIHRYSRGVPRHINKVCTRLFLHGYVTSKHCLDGDDVETIAVELQDEDLAPREVAAQAQGGVARVYDSSAGPDAEDLALRFRGPADGEGQSEGDARHAQAVAPAQVPAGNLLWQRAQPEIASRRPAGVPGNAKSGRVQQSALAAAARQLVVELRNSAGGFQWTERTVVLFGAAAVLVLSLVSFAAFIGPAGEDRATGLGTQGSPANRPVSGEDQMRTTLAAQSAGVTVSRLQEQGAGQVSVAARYPGVLTERRPPAEAELSSAGQASRLPVGSPGLRQDGSVTGTDVVDSGPDGAGAWDRDAQAERSEVSSVVPQTASLATAAGATSTTGRATASRARAQAGPVAAVGSLNDVQRSAGSAPTERSSDAERSRVDQLLARAGRALNRYRLLVPARDNAYGYYQEVLALQPGHPQARAGMLRIVDRYVSLVEQAIKAGDEDKARLYVARGLRVREDDPRLLALRETVNAMSRVVLSQEPVPPPDTRVEVWQPSEPQPEVKPVAPPADDVTNLLLRLRDFFTRNGAGSTVQSRSLTSEGN